MKRYRLVLLILVFVPFCSSCSTIIVQSPRGSDATQPLAKAAWAAFPKGVLIEPSNCPTGAFDKVVVKSNLAYDAVGILSLGFTQPVKLSWTCAPFPALEPGGFPGPAAPTQPVQAGGASAPQSTSKTAEPTAAGPREKHTVSVSFWQEAVIVPCTSSNGYFRDFQTNSNLAYDILAVASLGIVQFTDLEWTCIQAHASHAAERAPFGKSIDTTSFPSPDAPR